MSAPASLDSLQPLGWTLLIALAQTTLMALLVRAWLAWGVRPSARRHAVAFVALLASIVVAAGTYTALRLAPKLGVAAAVSGALQLAASGRAGSGMTANDPAAKRALRAPFAMTADTTSAAPLVRESRAVSSQPAPVILRDASQPVLLIVVTAWAVGAAMLLLRLGGGLVVVRRLRQRARPLSDDVLPARLLADRAGLAQVEWLQSADIDAPATVGWRRPAVILPAGLHESMAPELLECLLAHELEHIRRQDVPKALLQGAADALLFFCPGARWLSVQVRLAREERCDDAAVAACGQREQCAQALAALVGVQKSVPVVGALGSGAPSLAGRIRRLLRGEERMRQLTGAQVVLSMAGLAASALAVTAVIGAALVASAATPARVSGTGASAASGVPQVPSGFIRQQPGAPLAIARQTGGGGFVFETVRVRNVSEQKITSVRFVALIQDAGRRTFVRVVRTEPIAANLAPGEAAELRIALLSEEEAAAAHAQPMLGVVEVRFDDGDPWAVRLDTNARTVEDALYLEKPALIRALVGVPAASVHDRDCSDHRGFPYTQGAITRVVDGPPEWARCVDGAWLACQSPTSCPKLPRE